MPAKKQQGLIRIQVHIDPSSWTKLEWEAEHQGTTRPALIRRLFQHATRNTKPPSDPQTKQVQVSKEDWEKLTKVANDFEVSASKLVSSAIERLWDATTSDDEPESN